MKRLLEALVLSLLVLIPFSSHAQLDITRQRSVTTVDIASIRMDMLKMKFSSKWGYYIITNTSNRFDDPFIFILGEAKANALKSLTQLAEMCDMPEAETVTVKNFGKDCQLYTKGGMLMMSHDGYAGFSSFFRKEFVKLYRILAEFDDTGLAIDDM